MTSICDNSVSGWETRGWWAGGPGLRRGPRHGRPADGAGDLVPDPAGDQVLINFGGDGESLYGLSVLTADRRVVFETQAYVDGYSWDRLGAGDGEPLALQHRLVEAWPYGRRVRPTAE